MSSANPMGRLLFAGLLWLGSIHPVAWAQTPQTPASSEAGANAAERAAVLRASAIEVLEGGGPTELAVAQLTRAALLDPEVTDTWIALARGAGAIDQETPAWLRALRREGSRVRSAAATTGVAVQEAARSLAQRMGPRWTAPLSRIELWLALAAAAVLAMALRWHRHRRRRARALHPVCRQPARVVHPGGVVPAASARPEPALQPGPPVWRSADERALLDYLDRRPGAGGTAGAGILARV